MFMMASMPTVCASVPVQAPITVISRPNSCSISASIAAMSMASYSERGTWMVV
ncbi:hypothetical protein D3C86_1929630 [compost metagenome]